ncbi:MAG: hypothetical protein AB1445_11100 [Bacillota bacterium]
MRDPRNHLKDRLSAMERGLEGLVRRVDHLDDLEIDRMSREVDDLAVKYAKLLNLRVQECQRQ